MTNRSPLADQFAGLRAIPTTPNAVSRILSTALHTLIAAIFARIFDRLEQILLLWQAGTLVPLPPASCLAKPPRVRPPAVHRAIRHPRAIPAPAALIRALKQTTPAAQPRRATSLRRHPRPNPRPRPQPAHDPPPAPPSHPHRTSQRGCTSMSL